MSYRNKADQHAYEKQWRLAHVEYKRKKQSEYRARHRAELREKERKRHRRRHPKARPRMPSQPGSVHHCRLCRNAYQREYHRIRGQRERAAEGRYTCEDIARIRKLQKDRCGYCRIALKGKGTIDHIKPLVKGGTNWPSNLQLLCRSCNSSKCSHDPIAFARKRGLLL